ncbi:MAG: DUF362 domain-containing protein [Pseudomonadota bacterium]
MSPPPEPVLTRPGPGHALRRRRSRRWVLATLALPALGAGLLLVPGLPRRLLHWFVFRSRGWLPGSDQRAQRAACERLLAAQPPRAPAATVVRVHAPEEPSRAALWAMTDRAVAALCGTPTAAEGWRSLAAPGEKVAIRCGGDVRPAIIEAVLHGLVAAGVSARDVTVVLSGRGGMAPAVDQVPPVSWQRGAWADEVFMVGRIPQRLDRAVVHCDRLINLACLNTHVFCQFSGALKNHFGCVDQPWRMHTSFEHSAVLLNHLAPIRRRQVITLLDAISPALAGHPDFADPRFRWACHSLLASRDPVAADAVGIGLLEEGFIAMSVPGDLGLARGQLTLAAALGLGRADQEGIELRNVEIG